MGAQSVLLSAVPAPQLAVCHAEDTQAPEKEEEEEWREEFECPVCFTEMAPPAQIHQCGQGHLICGSCRAALQAVSKEKSTFYDYIKEIVT
jgi:hypothetical protein